MLDGHGWGIFNGHPQSWVAVCICPTAKILPALGSHVGVDVRCDRSQGSGGYAICSCSADGEAAREVGEVAVDLFVDLLGERAVVTHNLRFFEDASTVNVACTSCVAGCEFINAFL